MSIHGEDPPKAKPETIEDTAQGAAPRELEGVATWAGQGTKPTGGAAVLSIPA